MLRTFGQTLSNAAARGSEIIKLKEMKVVKAESAGFETGRRPSSEKQVCLNLDLYKLDAKNISRDSRLSVLSQKTNRFIAFAVDSFAPLGGGSPWQSRSGQKTFQFAGPSS